MRVKVNAIPRMNFPCVTYNIYLLHEDPKWKNKTHVKSPFTNARDKFNIRYIANYDQTLSVCRPY